MKILRIDDELHKKVKLLAEKDRRTINAMAEILLETGMGIPFTGNTPLPKNTSVQNLPDEMQNSITCPKCGMTSYNTNDIETKYCGNCHQYHVDILNEKKSEATPQTSDLFATPNIRPFNQADPLDASNPEQVCCKNELQPCKHWVWDVSTGEGYRNSLSGRFLEIE